MPKGVYLRTKSTKKKAAKNKSVNKGNAKQLEINLTGTTYKPTINGELLDEIIEQRRPSYHKKLMQMLENKGDELDLLRDIVAAFDGLTEDARYRAYAYFKDKFAKYAQQQI